MADVNASIPLQAQPMQLENPVDAYSRALTFKSLANKSQFEALQAQKAQQQFNDEQAVRNAYSNNTTVDASGVPTIDQAGVMRDLAKTAPSQLPAYQQQTAQQNAAILNNHLDLLNKGTQLFQGVRDQAGWTQAKQQYMAMGLPNSNQIPDQYDPNFQNAMISKAMDTKSYIQSKIAQQEADTKQQEVGVKAQDLALQRQKFGGENLQQTLTLLQSARGNPAVQKAENDIYSASKINSLVNQRQDPSQLSPTQVSLVAHEALKMATGGQGTEDELKDIKPNTAEFRAAQLYQSIKNAPTPAKAAPFVKDLQNYANSIKGDAQNLVSQNYQGIIESKKPWLNAQDYNNLQNQFMSRVNGSAQPDNWTQSQTNQGAAKSTPKEGDIYNYGGTVYKVSSGHWVAQPTQTADK